MQHTRKMVMVPEDAYTNLLSQQKQLYSPVVNQLSNLDQELQAVMADPNMSSDAKYHKYMNVFGRYQTLRNQQFKPTAIPAIQQQQQLETTPLTLSIDSERGLIDGLPLTVRRKGKLLLDHIKRIPEQFQFKKSGEIVIDGTPIPGSSVTDLVHFATRTRPSVKPPVGFDEFEQLLNETNVPKEALAVIPTAAATVGTTFPPEQTKIPRPKTRKTQLQKILQEKVARPSRKTKPPEKYGSWKKY